MLYTVSTQQHQYSNIMYAIGYTVATCFDRQRSSQANEEHFVYGTERYYSMGSHFDYSGT